MEDDGAIRLGLRYVSGLREQAGRAIAIVASHKSSVGSLSHQSPVVCPKCGCDDASMLEKGDDGRAFCNTCSHDWDERERASRRSFSEGGQALHVPRFKSLDDLVARAGLRRAELVTLADIGALNAFGYDRRSALWQAERAVRPAGELLAGEAGWAGEAGGDDPAVPADPALPPPQPSALT